MYQEADQQDGFMVKVPEAKPEYLSTIPQILMMEGQHLFQKVSF